MFDSSSPSGGCKQRPTVGPRTGTPAAGWTVAPRPISAVSKRFFPPLCGRCFITRLINVACAACARAGDTGHWRVIARAPRPGRHCANLANVVTRRTRDTVDFSARLRGPRRSRRLPSRAISCALPPPREMRARASLLARLSSQRKRSFLHAGAFLQLAWQQASLSFGHSSFSYVETRRFVADHAPVPFPRDKFTCDFARNMFVNVAKKVTCRDRPVLARVAR